MKRVKRVEYDPGWGWIARNKDGTEIMPGFCWASRSVARTVVAETDMLARGRHRATLTPKEARRES